MLATNLHLHDKHEAKHKRKWHNKVLDRKYRDRKVRLHELESKYAIKQWQHLLDKMLICGFWKPTGRSAAIFNFFPNSQM